MARKKKRGSGKARNVPPEEEPVAALQTEAEANTVEEEVPQNSSGGGEGPIASAEEASASDYPTFTPCTPECVRVASVSWSVARPAHPRHVNTIHDYT